MAQLVPNEPGWGTIIGEGLGHGTVATLQKLIDEKARKIEEKHEYERNLKFLKGAGYKNAEQLAHGSQDQLQQLLKSQPVSTSPSSGNSEYDQLLKQYNSFDQGQGDQELEQVLQGEPSPQGYANPKVQQALMQYIQSPQAQQEYTPEQLQKAQQKLQSYGQQQPSRTQQLLGKQQPPQQNQDKLYEQLLATAPVKELPRVKALREAKQKPTLENKGLTAAQKLKSEQDTQKKLEAKEHVQKAYDRTQEILDSGYTGYSLAGWTPEGRKLRNELDTLSEVFIANMIPLLNPKGTISKERFNYIKNLAPNSWDTDATIKGKMAALKEIFGLKGSSPEKSHKGTIEMRDAAGEIYDIPEDKVEEAKKAGLK